MGGSLLSQGGLLPSPMLPHKGTCQPIHGLLVGWGPWGVGNRITGCRGHPQLGATPPRGHWEGYPCLPFLRGGQGDRGEVEASPQRQALR